MVTLNSSSSLIIRSFIMVLFLHLFLWLSIRHFRLWQIDDTISEHIKDCFSLAKFMIRDSWDPKNDSMHSNNQIFKKISYFLPVKKCPGLWSCHWCWKVVIQNGKRSNFSWLAHSYKRDPMTSSYLLSLLVLRSSWTKAVEKQLTPGSLENEDKSSDEAVKLQWKEVSLVKTWAVKDRKPFGSSW